VIRRLDCPMPTARVARRHAVEEVEVAGVRCVWLDRGHAEAAGTLVYLHGGGFLFGPLAEQWAWLSFLARRTGMAVLMVDYRRVPEHPFPAAYDDAHDVIAALQEDGVLTDGSWQLAGDSAGGNLAVSVPMRLRDEGRGLPARILLMSPWLDVVLTDTEAEAIEQHDPMLWIDGVRMAGVVYAWEQDPSHPAISPLHGDPTGLPPILMQGGSAEVLAPDLRTFAARCIDAGVAMTYEEYRGAFHVFPVAMQLPEARRALRRQVRFLTAGQAGSQRTA